MLTTLVDEIIATGLSEADVAGLVKTSQPTINRIRHAQQRPGYELGKRLEKLHDERCKRDMPTGANVGAAIAERSGGATSILSAFFVGLAPTDRATFEREINQASADGARGEDWIAAMHAIAVRMGASFSLEELLAEWHADRWHAAAESSAWTWLPEEIRLLPGSRAVRDRQFAKAQTKGLEPAPIGPAPFDSGAAA
jgi:hypothetical protein